MSNLSTKGILGFWLAALAQMVVGSFFILVSGGREDDLFLLSSTVYTVLALIGASYMYLSSFGNRLVDRPHVIFVFWGLLSPVVGFVIVLLCVVEAIILLLSFKWMGMLFNYLKSSD